MRYIYDKKHDRTIDTKRRAAMRALADVARQTRPMLMSGRIWVNGWDSHMRADNYQWLLKGHFTAYKYY